MEIRPDSERDKKKQILKARMLNDPGTDEIRREEASIRRNRLRKTLIVLLVLALIALVLYVIKIINKNRLCTSYKVVWQEPFDAASGEFKYFSGGILRVTGNGMRYLDADGLILWDQACAIKNPRVTVKDGFALVADCGGANAWLIEPTGVVGKISPGDTITAASLSDHGVCAIMTDAGTYSNVYFYDKTGRKLDVEVDNAINDANGAPLGMALSPEGTGLVFSFVNVSEGKVDTWLTFMDLGTSDTGADKVTGAFKYESALYADVRYITDNVVCATGDKGIEFYSISADGVPTLNASVQNGRVIKSIETVNDELAVVYESEDAGYDLVFYGKDGSEGTAHHIDFEYSDIEESNGNLIIYNESRCMITGDNDRLIYDGEFSGYTYGIVVTALHELLQIGDYGMREVKLR